MLSPYTSCHCDDLNCNLRQDSSDEWVGARWHPEVGVWSRFIAGFWVGVSYPRTPLAQKMFEEWRQIQDTISVRSYRDGQIVEL